MHSERRSWLRGDSLALRVVAFLSLALLPIGLIAIYQTREFQREAMQRSELSLLALTERAASIEQQAIERAFGGAEALGVVIDLLDDESCSAYLRRFLAESNLYAFIGFVPPDGLMRCSSIDQTMDLSDRDNFDRLMASPRAQVTRSDSPLINGAQTIIVAAPISPMGNFAGYMLLAIPEARFAASLTGMGEDSSRPVGLVTFNGRGEWLTARGDAEAPEALLPAGVDLSDYVSYRSFAFAGEDAGGVARVFAVTPIVPGTVYAMGTWDPPRAYRSVFGSSLTVGLFPVLMWIASLVVAYYAVDRLVIRHVRHLGTMMRRFATDRHVPPVATPGMSQELREIEDEFRQMAAGIVQDEAQLEDTVRERGILLKEVHHRVKNNLQLISSIMSMQMRRTADPATKSILSRLQDRVLGLATIHRSLYQSNDMGRVNAAHLVREIVGQQAIGTTLGHDVQVRLDLDEIELLPDQAVPLSLLTAEAIANATNNLGAPDGEVPWITVTLRMRGGDQGWLEIANSVAPKDPDATEDADPGLRGARRRGLGLGMNLIHAFAAQLGGHCDIRSDGDYRVSTLFAVREVQPEPQDY